MLALTLHRPWPFAIFGLPVDQRKPIENRSWKPPPSLIGQRLAIHAGKHVELDAMRMLQERFGYTSAREPSVIAAGIIGTVLVKGWIRVTRDVLTRSPEIMTFEADALARSLWFGGPYGWVLCDPKPCTPIVIAGHQGLWPVPRNIARELLVEAA